MAVPSPAPLLESETSGEGRVEAHQETLLRARGRTKSPAIRADTDTAAHRLSPRRLDEGRAGAGRPRAWTWYPGLEPTL